MRQCVLQSSIGFGTHAVFANHSRLNRCVTCNSTQVCSPSKHHPFWTATLPSMAALRHVARQHHSPGGSCPETAFHFTMARCICLISVQLHNLVAGSYGALDLECRTSCCTMAAKIQGGSRCASCMQCRRSPASRAGPSAAEAGRRRRPHRMQPQRTVPRLPWRDCASPCTASAAARWRPPARHCTAPTRPSPHCPGQRMHVGRVISTSRRFSAMCHDANATVRSARPP